MDEGGYGGCIGLDGSTHPRCVLPCVCFLFKHASAFIPINTIHALIWTRMVGYYPCIGVDGDGYYPCIGLDGSTHRRGVLPFFCLQDMHRHVFQSSSIACSRIGTAFATCMYHFMVHTGIYHHYVMRGKSRRVGAGKSTCTGTYSQ